MCLGALVTVYLLVLGTNVVSTLKMNQVVVNMKSLFGFNTFSIISNQLTALLGSFLVSVALAP